MITCCPRGQQRGWKSETRVLSSCLRLKLNLSRQRWLFGRWRVELWKACTWIHAPIVGVMPHLLSLSYTSGMNLDFSLKLRSPNSDIFITYYFLPYSSLDPTLTKERVSDLCSVSSQIFGYITTICEWVCLFFLFIKKNNLLGSSNCCWTL